MTMISQPTTSSTVAGVATVDKTNNTYYDTYAIRSTYDGSAGTTVRFDYTAEGWQSARYPETAIDPGSIAYTHSLVEDYYPDGLLYSTRMLNGRQVYTYDANGNQTLAVEGEGVVQHPEKVLKVTRSFNGFNEEIKTTIPSWGNFLATSYSYDKNGRTTQTVVNAQEDETGYQVDEGRTFSYTYNDAGDVVQQTDDFFTPSNNTDDEKLTYTYTPTRLVENRTLLKAGDVQEQKGSFTYFDNGLLKTQHNYGTSPAQLLEAHTLSYLDTSGDYQNGNKTQDVFIIKGPDPSAPCYSSYCTATWTYDGSDRLISENTGTGNTVYYLDAIGNVTQASGSNPSQSTYAGQQMTQQTQDGVTSKFIYDGFGNVDCVVANSWSQTYCPASGDSNLLEDYAYDGLNRERSYSLYEAGARTYSITYLYDALNRVVREIRDDTSVTTRTDLEYEGDSTRVAKEGLIYDGWYGGPNSNTKTFAYDSDGQAITMTEWPSGQTMKRLSYLIEPGSSTSVLINQQGEAKESYGYFAYGSDNGALSRTTTGYSDGPVPTNPIRFQGKRFDTGSSSYDMGARRYDAEMSRWLQQDVYYDAVKNLGLTKDPLASNRYAFLGANPVNYVEYDGHCARVNAAGAERFGNGCGPQGWKGSVVPDKVKGLFNFKTPCENHDFCYGGGEFGTPKATCDSRFKDDMKESCGHPPWWKVPQYARAKLCREIADTYYNFVKYAGCGAYKNGQLNVCKFKKREKCIKAIKKNAGTYCRVQYAAEERIR